MKIDFSCLKWLSTANEPHHIKDVLYSIFGPDLVGLTVAVWNIVGWCFSAVCRGLNYRRYSKLNVNCSIFCALLYRTSLKSVKGLHWIHSEKIIRQEDCKYAHDKSIISPKLIGVIPIEGLIGNPSTLLLAWQLQRQVAAWLSSYGSCCMLFD